jgi:3-oxoacyl-(acyl-carrier-protein) synthase
MVAEVSAQAAEEARVSLGEVPVIVGSAFGELTTTMEMLHELATERAISPFRFHNSVHNTASGYLSIANANRLPATSVAAGDDTVSMVVLEALTLLAERGGRVLAVVADEALPTTMSGQRTQPLAAAMVLGAPGGSSEAPALAQLVELRRAVELGPEAGAAPTPTRDRAVDDDGPCLPLLRLCAAALDAGTLGRPIRVELTAGATPRWSIEVRP